MPCTTPSPATHPSRPADHAADLPHPPPHRIVRAARPPGLADDWEAPVWRDAVAAPIDRFHRKSRGDRPEAHAKLLYDDAALYVQFRVCERHVISRRTQRQASVSSDSCVELFIQPGAALEHGYFNFEVNCGGTLLAHFRHPDATSFQPLADPWLDRIGLYHTMPRRVRPHRAPAHRDPVTWRITLTIPLTLIEAYAGPLHERRPAPGVRWRANWYTCAWVHRRQRHWASWAPIGRMCDFHQPRRFGILAFE